MDILDEGLQRVGVDLVGCCDVVEVVWEDIDGVA